MNDAHRSRLGFVGRGLGRGAPLLLLCLVLTVFEYQVLFLGRTHLPVVAVFGVMGPRLPYGMQGGFPADFYRVDRGASAWVMEPQGRVVADAWRSGQLPMWNPYQGAGAPLAANAQSGGFDLLRLPANLVGTPAAWDCYYVGRLLLGLILAYLFGRSLHLTAGACFTLAIGYVFSGFFAFFGNNHFVATYLLLPGLMLGTQLVLDGRGRVGFAVLAILAAATQLTGMPEAAFCAFVYAGGYGAWHLGKEIWSGARASRVLTSNRARWLTGAWVTGLLLSAPLTVPLLEFIREAVHIHGADRQLGLTHDPWAHLALLAVPFLAGLPIPENIGWSYVGAGVSSLALLGALCIRHSRVGAYPLVAGVLLLGKVFGVPVVNELGRLPLVELMPVQKWGGPILSFALATLAAGAVDLLARGAVARTTRRRALVAVVSLGLAAISLSLPMLSSRGFPLSASTAWILIALGAGVGVLFGGTSRLEAGVWCLALVTLELFALRPRGNLSPRYDPYREPPFVSFLRQGERLSPGHRFFAFDGILHPNIASVYHLSDIRTLDALYPSRYFRYVRELVVEELYDRFTGVVGEAAIAVGGTGEGPVRVHGNPWFDLLGTRYVVGAPSFFGPGGSLSPPGSDDQYRLVYSAECTIHENLHAFPRAFLVGAVQWVSGPDDAVAAMKAPGFDPARRVVLEGWPAGAPLAAPGGAVSGSVVETHRDLHRVELDVHAETAAALVLVETYYPGWRATLDGRPVPILPANLAFRGVVLPPGRHHVEFRFEPLSVRLGLAMCGVGMLALAAALVATRGRPHREAAG